MSNAKSEYRLAYRVARQWWRKYNLGYEPPKPLRDIRHSVYLQAVISLQNAGMPLRYHWVNPYREARFRSTRYLIVNDIPF